MTGTHPPNYENYPPPTQDQRPPVGESTREPDGWTVVPAPTAPPLGPGRTSGPSRRGVLGLIGVLGVGLVGVVAYADHATGVGGLATGESSSWTDPAPEEDPEAEEFDLVGLTVTAPRGWEAVSSTAHRLVLRNGANIVTFLHYEAGQDASAMDEARQQLRRYAADVRSAKETSADTSTNEDGVEKAEVVLTGKVDDAAVDVVSSAAIDPADDYAAAAVVSVLAHKGATGIAGEVKRMRQELFDQLG